MSNLQKRKLKILFDCMLISLDNDNYYDREETVKKYLKDNFNLNNPDIFTVKTIVEHLYLFLNDFLASSYGFVSIKLNKEKV